MCIRIVSITTTLITTITLVIVTNISENKIARVQNNVDVLGVSTYPGDTALHVIPDPAVSNATTFNSNITLANHDA